MKKVEKKEGLKPMTGLVFRLGEKKGFIEGLCKGLFMGAAIASALFAFFMLFGKCKKHGLCKCGTKKQDEPVREPVEDNEEE